MTTRFWRGLAAVLVLAGAALPAPAVGVCFDYVVLRVACKDSYRASAASLREVLRQNGYGDRPLVALQDAAFYNAGALPLRPGDVILFGEAHAAIVESDGTLSHYLQSPGTVGESSVRQIDPKEVERMPTFHRGERLGDVIGFSRPVQYDERHPETAYLKIQPFLHAPLQIWRRTDGSMPCGPGGVPGWVLTTRRLDPDGIAARDQQYNAGRARWQISENTASCEGAQPVGDAPAPPWHAKLAISGDVPTALRPGESFQISLTTSVDQHEYRWAQIAGIGGGVGGEGVRVEMATPGHPSGRVACGWVANGMWVDQDQGAYRCSVPETLSPASQKRISFFPFIAGQGRVVEYVYEAGDVTQAPGTPPSAGATVLPTFIPSYPGGRPAVLSLEPPLAPLTGTIYNPAPAPQASTVPEGRPAPSPQPMGAFPQAAPKAAPAPDPANALGQPCAQGEAFVTSLYRSILDREPDAAGLQGNIGRLASGKPRDALYLEFFTSAEYLAKGKGDREFLRDCYQALLAREPGDADASIWLPQLQSRSLDRPGLIAQIQASGEYKALRANCP